MFVSKNLSTCFFGTATALVITIPIQNALALNPQELDAFASQTTVLIAPNLKKGDVEAQHEFNPGSGVIVAHSGTTYYVLTNLHVVEQDDLYGVRTADGDVHIVNPVDNPSAIFRFGTFQGSLASSYRPINGFDLAVVKFESDRNYPVVPITNQEPHQGETVFVSGWPNPENQSARRQRVSSQGLVSAVVGTPFPDGGYSILYNNSTQRGMSGGPIFNIDGEVVGIHGRGRSQGDVYCIDPQISIDNSCGIQAINFVTQAQLANLNLAFNYSPPNHSAIAVGIVTKSTADMIDDIYGLFTDLDKLKSHVTNLEERLQILEEKRH